MADPKKIRVKRVEAADPELKITLESETAGDYFPQFVRVLASVQWNGQLFPADGKNQNVPPGSLEVLVIAPFTDPAYQPGQTMLYDVTTIMFSTDGSSWTTFTGTIEDPSGTVISGA